MATVLNNLKRHVCTAFGGVVLLHVALLIFWWIAFWVEYTSGANPSVTQLWETSRSWAMVSVYYLDHVLIPVAMSRTFRRWRFPEHALFMLVIEGLFWYVMVDIAYHYSSESCPMGYLIPFIILLYCVTFQFPLLAILRRFIFKGVVAARPRWWRILTWALLLIGVILLGLIVFY